MPDVQDVSLVFIAYLIGSIPVGLLVSQAMGQVDIRRHGSGNIGTANVLRIVGKRAAALTLLGDLLKGLLPTWAAIGMEGSELLVVTVAVAAVLGHNWSVFLGFVGGKGVATSFGALLAMTPFPALLGLVIWLVVVLAFRYTSLAAMISSVCIPPIILISIGAGPYFGFSLVAALLIFVRHRDNIKRLLAGTEHQVGQRGR